jgi:hypothetical protein
MPFWCLGQPAPSAMPALCQTGAGDQALSVLHMRFLTFIPYLGNLQVWSTTNPVVCLEHALR